jgi:hypothetical protein
MIKLGLVSAQTSFDVAQALAVSQLCKGHTEKLIEMRKFECWIPTGVFGNALAERV